jgi:Family of unknown function (DUF6308)
MRHTPTVGTTAFSIAGTRGQSINYTLDIAFSTLLEFCFGERQAFNFGRHLKSGWPIAPINAHSRAYAYRTYDCIHSSSGRYLTESDILVTLGLNSGFGTYGFSGAANLVFPIFDSPGRTPSLCGALDFEFLPRTDLVVRPAKSSAAYPLWSAWNYLTNLQGVGTTVAHKALHHKWPDKCPLYDDVVSKFYGTTRAWETIHDILNSPVAAAGQLSSHDALIELTDEFNCLVNEMHLAGEFLWAVPLTKLRVLDILVWTYCDNGNTVLTPQASTTTLQGRFTNCCCS